MHTLAGRAFVQFYYEVSPPLARVISTSAPLRGVVRMILIKPVIGLLQWVGWDLQESTALIKPCLTQVRHGIADFDVFEALNRSK